METTFTGDSLASPHLKEKINIRYTEVAKDNCCTSLSCGRPLEYAKLQPGQRVVDLGSGKGMEIFKAAKLVAPNGEAIGIDYTEKMVEIAEINKGKLAIDNAFFIVSPIDSLPMANDSVDWVISNCTINHAPNKERVYQEIYRILRDDGSFIVSDIMSETQLPEEVRSDPQAWAACYGGAITIDQYLHAIADAGFPKVVILEQSAPYEKGGVKVISLTLQGYKTDYERQDTNCCGIDDGNCCL